MYSYVVIYRIANDQASHLQFYVACCTHKTGFLYSAHLIPAGILRIIRVALVKHKINAENRPEVPLESAWWSQENIKFILGELSYFVT
jgi:hypothetical protein